MTEISKNGYTWYLYDEVPKYWNVDDMRFISSNFETIRTILINNNYTVENLKDISVKTFTHVDKLVDIFKNVEYNLNIINSTEDFETPYFGGEKSIGIFAPNKTEIWRWIQVLNDLFNVLIGEQRMWARLRCVNGYPVEKNGNKLILRGEYIGIS